MISENSGLCVQLAPCWSSRERLSLGVDIRTLSVRVPGFHSNLGPRPLNPVCTQKHQWRLRGSLENPKPWFSPAPLGGDRPPVFPNCLGSGIPARVLCLCRPLPCLLQRWAVRSSGGQDRGSPCSGSQRPGVRSGLECAERGGLIFVLNFSCD